MFFDTHLILKLNTSQRGYISRVACRSGIADRRADFAEMERIYGLNKSIIDLTDSSLLRAYLHLERKDTRARSYSYPLLTPFNFRRYTNRSTREQNTAMPNCDRPRSLIVFTFFIVQTLIYTYTYYIYNTYYKYISKGPTHDSTVFRWT